MNKGKSLARISKTVFIVGLVVAILASTAVSYKHAHAEAAMLELWLRIDGVRVHRRGYEDEGWINITVIATQPFELLSLWNASEVLAPGELPVGNYTKIGFHVVDAWARTTEEPFKPLKITAPWLTIKISFTVEETPVKTVIIDVTVNEKPIINGGKLPSTAQGEVGIVE